MGQISVEKSGLPGSLLSRNQRSKGTCSNNISITRQIVEARVLAGLQDRLLTPELVATFVTTFQQELARLHRESGQTQARLKDQLAAVDRKHEGVMRAIENGAWNDSIQKRLNELEAQQASLRQQLQAATSGDTTPRASTTTWILALIPPRERPIARASAPLFLPAAC